MCGKSDLTGQWPSWPRAALVAVAPCPTRALLVFFREVVGCAQDVSEYHKGRSAPRSTADSLFENSPPLVSPPLAPARRARMRPAESNFIAQERNFIARQPLDS